MTAWGPQTRVVQAAVGEDPAYGAVMPPLYLSTNFRFPAPDDPPPYDYTRSGNPTRAQLETALAELEGGASAVATSSGMSAVSVVLSLLEADDLVVVNHDCYGGTHRLLEALRRQGRLRVAFVDFHAPDAFDLVRAARPRMIWLETPSNPLLRITDLGEVARLAASLDAWSVADNTFLSPALQRPLDFGFDLVVHSTTKLINGHSDMVGGAVVAADPAVGEDVAWWANCLGVTQSPFDSYMTLRGVRTLFARADVHDRNTRAVVDVLGRHPQVERVYHPGLPGHPGHDVARRQQRGFGSLVSFELAGGRDAVGPFLKELRLFTLAESLGGVESLVCHPPSMTHASMEPPARERAGIRDNLLRLSVGIEGTRDLVEDLERALDRVGRPAEAAPVCAAGVAP